MDLFGLIGYPLTHSFSPQYFAKKFEKEGIKDVAYRKFEIPQIEDLPKLLAQEPTLRGFNVTIPYKQDVQAYLGSIHPAAIKIGAVNVVKVAEDGTLSGYNSDYYGFRQSLEQALERLPTKALILGTGGASRAVKTALDDLSIEATFISRSPKDGFMDAPVVTYGDISPTMMEEHLLVVNTTPLGTYPNTNASPEIPYGLATKQHFFYDLVYNPEITEFMHKGAAQGARAMNGLQMLHLQAEKSWEIWKDVNL